ncbi:hypothetical protein Emin_0263 [Elusimicrobium minutum Pei191]|uniref:Lipoprotein n=1 Tax=Elusimicrobium minutum (strain Pei191) TaxID=445932 RepID=B2KB66_ELUMP|nr:hypothetical protein [Elusimicrobium minutum]ACC97825.1 hypothetical protein Emin_0263 [Elusimicrobium minutum Pei191]
MKKLIPVLSVCCIFLIAACSSSNKKNENKMLFIEEGEYEASLNESTQNERRGARLMHESNYLFRLIPQSTYFFDEKNMPLDDVTKSASDYKAGRLWTRPKRYMPGEYKTDSSSSDSSSSSTATAADDESSYSSALADEYFNEDGY